MMQSANLEQGDNLPLLRRLYPTRLWSLLAQTQVGSTPVILIEVTLPQAV